MKSLGNTRLLLYAWGMLMFAQVLHAAGPITLTDRLQQTRAVNIDVVIDSQFAKTRGIRGFRVADPYSQESTKTLQVWNRDPRRDEEVCAMRFVDDSKVAVARFQQTNHQVLADQSGATGNDDAGVLVGIHVCLVFPCFIPCR